MSTTHVPFYGIVRQIIEIIAITSDIRRVTYLKRFVALTTCII